MQRWELLCPECEEWCQTGIHSRISLWIPGQFRSFSNHRGSKKCEATAKKKKKTGNTPDAPIPRSLAASNVDSIREIVNKLEDALEGVYCPRGYGADDLDIATLVYRLGGRQLLFALNKTLGLPSLRTLQTCSVFNSITPTIGPIVDQNFDNNIRSIVLNTHVGVTSPRGISLMVDEMAIEEMAIHYPRYNKIGGLCWKHSSLIDPVLRTYDSVVRIAQKIHDGEVHLGKEVTVIGAACFGEEELYPILVVPTCKTEDSKDTKIVLARAIQRWSATGADQIVGPVWSFATDGHRLFLKNPLSMHSPLYGILSNMAGLNTFTGDDEITLDFDFKHIFKHESSTDYSNDLGFCTLIRSPAGITLNNGRLINAVMLARYLVWLPAYDEASVVKLLHLDDPQDVPRAIELMSAIIDLSKSQHTILNNSFSSDIDTCADLASITLLSSVIESILIPFINVDLSLTEQVQYLSRYTHLSFALFRSH
ncbi:hypothetical protein DEU56DRAFT_870487 [Suillus clintonianus]|uniref:uncharacterized protein n=1 Tax=Suillus clintonianus TaxID=1904413 RepID=UPI001B879073|nr:uncharacterized protein DEU56DRAFT_870487 [Suillus clintonianus]KAG2143675.1 hypothetical protein DEU56DRAFT_870487 [Suillus clintonianus]